MLWTALARYGTYARHVPRIHTWKIWPSKFPKQHCKWKGMMPLPCLLEGKPLHINRRYYSLDKHGRRASQTTGRENPEWEKCRSLWLYTLIKKRHKACNTRHLGVVEKSVHPRLCLAKDAKHNRPGRSITM